MRRKEGRIFWLVYIDSTVPRSLGRIIPRSSAVPRPTFEEVAKALERLNVKFEAYKDKKYPALWYDERGQGYFVVYAEDIRELARRVAREIANLRR